MADTELSRTFPFWLRAIGPLLRPFLNSPAEGALPTLLAATSNDVASAQNYGPTGSGERARGAGPARIAEPMHDEVVAKRLWDLSASLTGVSYLS